MWLQTFQKALRGRSPLLCSWCICFVAASAFICSSLLYLSEANVAARFWVGLLAVVTLSIVQRFAALEIYLVLVRRERLRSALAVEIILG
jgi:hypothetical protein